MDNYGRGPVGEVSSDASVARMKYITLLRGAICHPLSVSSLRRRVWRSSRLCGLGIGREVNSPRAQVPCGRCTTRLVLLRLMTCFPRTITMWLVSTLIIVRLRATNR